MSKTKLKKNNWRKARLGDIAEVASSKRIYQSDYVTSGIPFYRSKEIIEKGENKLISTKLFITKEKFIHIKEKFGVPEAGDLLITSVGTLGKIYQVKAKDIFYFKDGNLIWLRNFKELAVSDYLFYLIKSEDIQHRLKSTAIGSSQSAFTISCIKEVEVLLPPKYTQKQIADVLSIYDDLIENNTRRIQILEELAQAIYKEWFVKFRFPGHESVRMVESKTEFGMIPEGWRIISMIKTKYFKFINENVKKFSGTKIYYATADVDGFTISGKGVIVTFIDKPSRAQKQPDIFSVWFARMKDTYKVLGFTEINKDISDNSILSSGFAGFSSEKKVFPFLYYTINSKKFHENKNMYCTGATQMSLTNDGLKRVLILEPSLDLIARYSEKAFPLVDKIFHLQKQNRKLSQARDLLLPKLVTGEIEV